MTDPLSQSLANHCWLSQQLREQFPAEDDEALADTLEGISDLNEQIIHVLRSAESDEAMVLGINDRIAELHERRDRFARRIEKKRELVADVMERAGLRKITAPDFTVSLAHRPGSVVITDETMIPPDYLKTPEPPAPRPDKKLILQAMKDGFAVPGAVLGNGGVSITVRKK